MKAIRAHLGPRGLQGRETCEGRKSLTATTSQLGHTSLVKAFAFNHQVVTSCSLPSFVSFIGGVPRYVYVKGCVLFTIAASAFPSTPLEPSPPCDFTMAALCARTLALRTYGVSSHHECRLCSERRYVDRIVSGERVFSLRALTRNEACNE